MIKYCDDCANYDYWVDYNDYGGLVNECRTCDLFCFPTETANTCLKFKEKESN